MENEFRPGLYEHHKGGRYRALFKARLSEAREVEVVVYVPLTPHPESPYPPGQPWVRPYEKPETPGDDCWCDVVEWPDGTLKPRFVRIGD